MGKVTIFEMSGSAMESAVARQAGTLEVMAAPRGMGFKVEIEYDSKIEKEAAKDPLLDQEMRDAIRAVYDDLIERIADNLEKTDRGAIQLRDTNQLEKMKKLVEVVSRGIDVLSGAGSQAQLDAIADFDGVETSHGAHFGRGLGSGGHEGQQREGGGG